MALAETVLELDHASRASGPAELVSSTIAAVRIVLESHVRRTEGDGGLFGDVAERAPHLLREIQRLATEHAEFRSRLDVLSPLTAPIEPEQDEVRALVRALAHHLDREDALVWQAYDVDLGGGG